MDCISKQVRMDIEIGFHSPGGPTVVGRLVRAGVSQMTRPPSLFSQSQYRTVECTLRLLLSPDTWRQVDKLSLFHLELERRGVNFRGEFDPDRDVELTLMLQPELCAATALFSELEALSTNLSDLSEAQRLGPLFSTDFWYAVSVTQTDGPFKQGFSTSWLAELAAPRRVLRAKIG